MNQISARKVTNRTLGAMCVRGAEVVVDLQAIATNYQRLCRFAGNALGAVVKANGYGLGAIEIAGALERVGCADFFVAHLFEGQSLAPQLSPASRIYVLHGLWPGEEAGAAQAGIIPVLNSLDQIHAWIETARGLRQRLPAALQLDTGMSRLGLPVEDAMKVLSETDAFQALEVRLLMTHMACAETPGAPANQAQVSMFGAMASVLPPTATSIANSATTVGHWAPRSDLGRVGIGLFGVNPIPGRAAGLTHAVSIRARVVQVRRIEAGASVGYGHRYTARSPRMIATLAIGYADGWPRSLDDRGSVFFGDTRLPVIGRVSMDSCVVDATDATSHPLRAGDWVELVGPHQTLEEVATAAGTIPYDILVRLGNRLERRYTPTSALSGHDA